jgi:Kef-type K+ transport system membrane component KefB
MQTPFGAAPHHDILVLLVQLAVLLLTARILGEVAQRLRQPSVVGEILAGIVLGPSLLSGWVPALEPWLVPQTPVQGYLLEVISLLGAMFLLLLTGLEMDLGLVRRRARVAIGVSLGGVTTTLVSGFCLGWLLPSDMRAEGASQLVFAMFMGTAMSISAIPVIAKVLMDLKVMRRDIGQTIIAAGMSDDTIGWILLSVVAALATGEAVTAGSVATTVATVLGFMVFSFTIGRWMVARLLALVQDRAISGERLMTLVVALTFAWAALTQALHLEAVLGAFVMGILFGQMRRLPSDVVHRIESVGLGIFAPIFFAVAGLKVDLRSLMEPRLLGIAALVILVASVGKFTGTYLGARFIGGRPHLNALAYGAGLNARGAMEILIATIGLRLGVLSPAMFSVIVVMAITTSLMAPPALRWVLTRLEPEAAERDRMARETLRAQSRLGRMTRALVPVRVRPAGEQVTQHLEAHVLAELEQHLAITLFTVCRAEDRARATAYLTELRALFPHTDVTIRVAVGDDPAALILDEASRDYDLLLVGAPEQPASSGQLFHPVIDTIVQNSTCPTLVIRGSRPEKPTFRRILVPSLGTNTDRTAAELAFLLARGTACEVLVEHFVESNEPTALEGDERESDRQVDAARESLESISDLARLMQARADTSLRFSTQPIADIVRRTQRGDFDLLVVGSDVMSGTHRLYLGSRVERLLAEAACPVLIVNA